MTDEPHGEWVPVDYFDLRKGDVVMIVTAASHDSPNREAAAQLGPEWRAVLKVGMTDRNTHIARWTPSAPEGPSA